MKRIFLWICIFCFIFGAVAPVTLAADATHGLTLSPFSSYTVNQPFSAIPLSFEAWVKLPDGTGRSGVLLGNYGSGSAFLSIEIDYNNYLRVYAADSAGAETDLYFMASDIPTDTWVHLAIVHDTARKELAFYINGEHTETLSNVPAFDKAVLNTPFGLFGDHRRENPEYFKGSIRSLSLFASARSAEEIQGDMGKINTADPNLIAHYDMSRTVDGLEIQDFSSNGYDTTYNRIWYEEKFPVTDYAYAFCVVGDTQMLTLQYPDKFDCIYDWIVENEESKKIEYVFGLGDINFYNLPREWELAKKGIAKLNGLVDYSLVRGNHDRAEEYNNTFCTPEYTKQFNGFYKEGKIENSWRTFSVCDTDYLFITLDYRASDAVLNWAGDIITQYPDHRVIITTHSYLYLDGTTVDITDDDEPLPKGANTGENMWNKLISKHKNIFMVISGHIPTDNVIVSQVKGDHGNIVTQMLIDPQDTDAKYYATGMVAMLYFSNDGKTVTTEYYSTVRKQYFMSTNQMVISLDGFPVVTQPVPTPPLPPENEPTIQPSTVPADTDTPNNAAKSAIVLLLTGTGALSILISRRRRKRS